MCVGMNSFFFKCINELMGDFGGYEIGEEESIIEDVLSG